MADSQDNNDIEQLKQLQDDLSDFIEDERRDVLNLDTYIETLYYLWILWADFHLYIVSPYIEPIHPPLIIEPQFVEEHGEYEHVYAIHDAGYLLSTSRQQDIVLGLRSMNKFFNTIEKMIRILVERLKTGGFDEQEVQVSFRGHELGQRKAFESILNLTENVVVTNFEPGEWGERFLKNIEEMAKRGYGLPKSSPRSIS